MSDFDFDFDFADRYAQAGLQPTPEIIAVRQLSAARVYENAERRQLLDLVSAYYGLRPELTWFRDELRKEDPTFSLITGQRESVILAATILAAKVAEGDPTSILGIVVGSVQGKRAPVEAVWLLDEAHSAMSKNATTARIPRQFATPIRHSITPKLADEIAAASDLAGLGQVLLKVRNESQATAEFVAKQVTDALLVLNENAGYQREESQILWWLFGEHSRSLNKPFGAFRPAQAALVGGIELGELSTASVLGPVAAPAVLDRVLRGAKKDSKAQPITLRTAVDGLGTDLPKLKSEPPERPGICPVLTALRKAKEIGGGVWGNAFHTATGLDAGMEFEAIELAQQVYYEHLLGLAK